MKSNIKVLIGIIIGILISSATVYAATQYLSSDIVFTPTNSNWNVSNVEEALNQLYEKNNGSTDVSEVLINQPWDFDYRASELTFIVPVSGYYKLEAWGAQGGTANTTVGGYGAYSVGTIYLEQKEKLYINVGGMGANSVLGSSRIANGGYNGGGYSFQKTSDVYAAGGGGATHIAKKSGLLSTLSGDIDSILIVASGGAGGYYYSGKSFPGNSGGGYMGAYSYDSSTSGTQKSGYAFGQGGFTSSISDKTQNRAGGGGGFYGGKPAWGEVGAGGGSSYIGNSNLKDKAMYCYNCNASTADMSEDNKTIATTSTSWLPISNYAKSIHGHARITLVSTN